MFRTSRMLMKERVWCTEPRVSWISVALLAATIGVFASGIPCTFPLYAGILQSFFKWKQPQVSCITSVYAIGEGFHFPAAILESKAGPRWTMLMAAMLTSAGFFLLYLSFVLSSLRNINFVFVALFFFLVSNGRSFTFIGAFSCAISNTPTSHRAKVVAFLDIAFEIGSLMQIAFYYNIFHGNAITVTDIANFTMFSLCLSAICHLLCAPFLVRKELSALDESKSNDTAEESESNDTAEESESNDTAEESESNDTIEESAVLKSNTAVRLQSLNKSSTFKFLFSAEFLLLNFSMSLPIAFANTFFYNTANFTESLDLGLLNPTLLTVFKTGSISFRILAGLTIDRFRSSIMIYVIILAVCIQTVTGQALSLLSLYVTGNVQIAFLLIGYLTSGITLGAMYFFTPILLSDICGLSKVARNVSIVYSCSTILNVIIQTIYGQLCDSMQLRPSNWNGNSDTTALRFTGNNNSNPVDHLYTSYLRNKNTSTRLHYNTGNCIMPTFLLTTCLAMAALVMFVLLALRLHDRLLCVGPTKYQHINEFTRKADNFTYGTLLEK